MKAKFWALATGTIALLGFTACSGGSEGVDEDYGSVQNAQTVCTVAAPVITEVREENPGAVAAGVTKIYHVQARNENSAGCAPASVAFVPDAFQFFSIVPQPSNIGGVSSGSTANFRVAVTSDPSLPEGVTDVGFTLVVTNPAAASTTARGSLRYEIDFDNPVGCNRQVPQVEVQTIPPAVVPRGGTIDYRVTVRNVDNVQCGPDTFAIGFDFARNFALGVDPVSATIPAGGSAVFGVTASSDPIFIGPGVFNLGFRVFGDRHPGQTGSGTLRYEVR